MHGNSHSLGKYSTQQATLYTFSTVVLHFWNKKCPNF
jgi:hypothetical protein